MSMFMRVLPLAGFMLFFAVGVVWRSWLQYRRHGHAGVILFRSSGWRQALRDTLLVLLILMVAVPAVAFAMAPQSLSGCYLVAPPTGGGWMAIGSHLLFGGTAYMVMAQHHHGASRRIGIEEGSSPGLVTGGLYRFCRNPIFLGIFLHMAGLVILIPTWLTAAMLLVTIICVRSQVIEEEAYLLRTYGEAYRSFARRVGRFLPGVGVLQDPA
jgi:protein-S-isoprenylcysteine O-methyltransferase Ste14